MQLQDLNNNIEAKPSLNPATRSSTATVSGTTVAMTGDNVWDGALVNVIVGSYTDGTHDIKLQERNTGGTFSDVSSGDIDGTQPTLTSTGDASAALQFGYKGNKDELRVVADVTGVTTGAVYGADVVLGGARDYPVT